jgi:asparagine synthase (glutamine-hydrolysing)
MCGICGIISLSKKTLSPTIVSSVQKMNDALAHRGPDDAGIWQEGSVALGHRRLSIMDLSQAGHQPMYSNDNQLVISFNGEIYNYQDVKKKTPQYAYKSNSDTESLLAGYEKWGTDLPKYLNGMFAFALWNKPNESLFIARDHIGIKPLYYAQVGDYLIFASEIRAILASGLVERKLDTSVIGEYLRYQTVHAPKTLIKGISQLLPGHSLTVKNGQIDIQRYWHFDGKKEPISIKEDRKTVEKRVRETIAKAVDRQMMSDVPFGAFLSGGIDSSIIVSLMREVTAGDIETFNISFTEKEYDEAPYARQIAERFKTKHHEIKLSPQHFLDSLPHALDALDHPTSDAVNTYVVAQATRQQGIKMALSGLGGDELFGGYPIFQQSMQLQKLRFLNAIPQSIRQGMGALVKKATPSVSKHKMATVLAQETVSPASAYPYFREIFTETQRTSLLNNGYAHAQNNGYIFSQIEKREKYTDMPIYSQISVAEMSGYMQNVLLRDSDQMSMAHALELRVPLLDVDLIELVLSIPDHFKQGKGSKPLLVSAMSDLIPPAFFDRTKMGFLLPFERWMRHELKDFCENRLQNLAARPEFYGETILGLWQSFLRKEHGITWSRLWVLVALSHWLEKNEIK